MTFIFFSQLSWNATRETFFRNLISRILLSHHYGFDSVFLFLLIKGGPLNGPYDDSVLQIPSRLGGWYDSMWLSSYVVKHHHSTLCRVVICRFHMLCRIHIHVLCTAMLSIISQWETSDPVMSYGITKFDFICYSTIRVHTSCDST